MRRILILATTIITMMIPAWAVGTTNQSLAQIAGSTSYVYTENWIADAANGSVPATVMAGVTPIQGFRIISVEIAPGSPAPTNNYTVTVTDFSGADLLAGSGANQSNTTAGVLPSLSNSPPIYGSLTVNVTGNSVNSAQGKILIYFAPISQIVGNTSGGPSLTGTNLFTGSNTLTGTTTFTGPVSASNTATFTGATSVCQANSVLYVGGPITCWAGSDIGAQLNTAYSALPATGGIIYLLAQTGANAGVCYTFTTPITFTTSGKAAVLSGVAANTATVNNGPPTGPCLNYTPTTATAAVTLDFAPTGGNTGNWSPGAGMQNLTLINNNCLTNFGCGSSAVGIQIGNSNGGCFKCAFQNMRIEGFGTGFANSNSQSWGMQFLNNTVGQNTTGYSFQQMENSTFVGGTIILNGTGISTTGTSGDYHLFSVSLDTNTLGINDSNTGIAEFTGMHFENNGASCASASSAQYIQKTAGHLIINGGTASDDCASGTTANWWFNANGGDIDIQGLTIFSAGRGATQIAQVNQPSTGWIQLHNAAPTVLTTLAGGSSLTAPGRVTLVPYNGGYSNAAANWTIPGRVYLNEASCPASGNSGTGNTQSLCADSVAHITRLSQNGANYVPIPTPIYSTAGSTSNTNIAPVTMVTAPGSNGFCPNGASCSVYAFDWYIYLSTAGTSCTTNTTFTFNIIFTPWEGSAITIPFTETVVNNGTLGGILGSGRQMIMAGLGTAVQWSVTGYTAGAGCSPAPTYQVIPSLSQLN